RVKVNRSYTVEEAAEAVGATPQTVRIWIKSGLLALEGQRPVLILGWALKDFLARAGQHQESEHRLISPRDLIVFGHCAKGMSALFH
ncbi:MAG: helix-turn-helix domain-containing protein, partial [Pseudomonadota bacterium]|nr:helix-turn-helix domain-containing protein [Pseudomonadota bacterium]